MIKNVSKTKWNEYKTKMKKNAEKRMQRMSVRGFRNCLKKNWKIREQIKMAAWYGNCEVKSLKDAFQILGVFFWGDE